MGAFRQKGYSLIELLLTIAIVLSSIVAIYALLKPASLKAGIEREQVHINSVIDAVQGAFGRTGGNYQSLSNEELARLRLPDLRLEGSSLTSATGDTMIVRPAQIFEAGDGFDVVYQGLSRQKCLGFVRAFYPKSYTILVGNAQEQVQAPSVDKSGALVSEDRLISACTTKEFQQQSGSVIFRFYERLSPGGSEGPVSVAPGGICRAQNETKNEDCPPGQTGLRILRRTSSCSTSQNGGTPQNPAMVWSDWAVLSDSCEIVTDRPTPPSPRTQTCFPRFQNKMERCPSPQTGDLFFERELTCSSPFAATETIGDWALIRSTCNTVESKQCVPSSETRPLSDSTGKSIPNGGCPDGYGGQVTEARSSSCSAGGGAPVWSDWAVVSNTCVISGSCHPLPTEKETRSCPKGQVGVITKTRHSICASANGDPAWGPWKEDNGCANNPAAVIDVFSWTPQKASASPNDKFVWDVVLDSPVPSDAVFTVALRLKGYQGPAVAFGQLTVYAGQRTASFTALPLSSYTPVPSAPLKYNAELLSAKYDTSAFVINGLPVNSSIDVNPNNPSAGDGFAQCTAGNSCHMEAYYRLEECGNGDGSTGGAFSGTPKCANNTEWWHEWLRPGGREQQCLDRLAGGGIRTVYICR